MFRATPLLALLALLTVAAAPSSAAACKSRPLTDLQLADDAEHVFIGHLLVLDRAAPRATYRVERTLKGSLRPGQQVTVRHCGADPQRNPRRHLLFTDSRRVLINGVRGVAERWQAGHVALLTRWLEAADDPARAALLLASYHDGRDRVALRTLIDAPSLLAHIDADARTALVRTIGASPWTQVEVAALARLRAPAGLALLRVADARCQGTFDPGTACDAGVSNALALLERPAPEGGPPALATLMRTGDVVERLLALDRCEQLRGAGYDLGFYAPTYTTRFDPASIGLIQGDAAWARAAAWCEHRL